MSGDVDYIDGEPIPQLVANDQILIFDPIDFADKTDSIALRVVDDVAEVLDKDSLLWRVIGVRTVRGIK